MHLPLHDVYILAAVEDSETKMLRRNWLANASSALGQAAAWHFMAAAAQELVATAAAFVAAEAAVAPEVAVAVVYGWGLPAWVAA